MQALLENKKKLKIHLFLFKQKAYHTTAVIYKMRQLSIISHDQSKPEPKQQADNLGLLGINSKNKVVKNDTEDLSKNQISIDNNLKENEEEIECDTSTSNDERSTNNGSSSPSAVILKVNNDKNYYNNNGNTGENFIQF